MKKVRDDLFYLIPSDVGVKYKLFSAYTVLNSICLPEFPYFSRRRQQLCQPQEIRWRILVSLVGDNVKVKKISRMLYKATTADTIRGKVEEEGTFNICEFSCLCG